MILKEKSFKTINVITISAVYLLIFVGGVVRNMDSGMGCPDWPKCFGSYVPPSDESELPLDYQKAYRDLRVKKNERLASYLNVLGLTSLSSKIKNEPMMVETSYDYKKAWIEYGNRLLGIIIGFLIILNTIWSFSSKSNTVRYLGLLALVTVIVQGWIGSVVVSTNLLPGLISFHLSIAILLVVFLLSQRALVSELSLELKGQLIIKVLIILFFFQILMGTWVRGQIDVLHALGISKESWINRLDFWFYIHRSFSIVLILLTGYLYLINKNTLQSNSFFVGYLALVLLEIALGAVMVYFQFPIVSQPLHLLLATGSFGLLFLLFLQTRFNKKMYAVG